MRWTAMWRIFYRPHYRLRACTKSLDTRQICDNGKQLLSAVAAGRSKPITVPYGDGEVVGTSASKLVSFIVTPPRSTVVFCGRADVRDRDERHQSPLTRWRDGLLMRYVTHNELLFLRGDRQLSGQADQRFGIR